MKMMMKYFVRTVASLLVMFGCVIPALALDKSFYAESSKLATGKWVKIAVTESGIYQITADDISRWGLGSDLSQIHVFGYGGAPLSETMRGDNYADDLPQMPVVRTADRILFYAQGPLTWKRLNGLVPLLQVQHPYAKSGAYFVTNDSRFSDIAIDVAEKEPTGDVVTTYTERLFHEQEIANPGETGRVFLGENFMTTKKQSFDFKLDGLIEGSRVYIVTEFGAQTKGANSTVTLSCNDTVFTVTDFDVIGTCDKLNHTHYKSKQSLKSIVPDGTDNLKFTVNYSCPGNVYVARLNYITVNYQRAMALKKGSLSLPIPDAKTSTTYQVSGCSASTRVWDVTAPYAPVQMKTALNDGNLKFSPSQSGRREFIVFDESGTYSKPELLGEVSNQDIHAQPTPDMIILAPSAYLEQAARVAALHERYDHFRVLVLDHEKVFNEFSSGTQDAMAYRRLCKMFYDRGRSEDGHQLGYLLLMGNGNYDNRSLTNSSALNYPRLLTWQSEDSNDEDKSISSDDYFGVLTDGSIIADNVTLNIAVGRMPAKSVAEARTLVNKLEKYITKPSYGAWKNQVLMAADDENDGKHMRQSKSLIKSARENGGNDMVFNYVFIDAFNSVSQGGSRSYPDARNKMFNLLNEGVLWWNYIGHASTQNWTGEGLLTRTDVETNLYYRHLPVLYAATCEFCRYDNSILSSGERMLLNANGGVIAMLCPSRLAYVDENGLLSKSMGKYVFSPDAQGLPRRIGDIMRLAKNENVTNLTSNNRRFHVFGDPAMRLAYAPYSVQVETINGEQVSPDKMPHFKARQRVDFAGKIVDWKGNLAEGFNGTVVSTLFGPEQEVITHGYGEEGDTVHYYDRPNRLAITVDTVMAGRFNVSVIIPSEVNNEYDNFVPSLINLYAYDSADTLEAKGSNSNFCIYGYEQEEVADTIGPDIIVMGLNDEQFVDGADVNESPLLLATVGDESGVNFSSAGIGHSMSLTLDGTISYNDLVGYYTPLYADEGTLGSINYQLSDLSPGLHTLRLRVWDVYNNVNERTIRFNVVHGLAPEIADVYCSPSPASYETSFYVKHNRPDAVVSVTIEVYDLMGHKVWSSTQSARSDMYTSTPVTWDLIDVGGRRVPRGIYVYRATITTDGVKEATKAKKLAVTSE